MHEINESRRGKRCEFQMGCLPFCEWKQEDIWAISGTVVHVVEGLHFEKPDQGIHQPKQLPTQNAYTCLRFQVTEL